MFASTVVVRGATVSDSPPLFDATSRTLKLRLEADNPGLFLRPDMYVDIEFRAPAPNGISVPAEAILDSGMQKIVQTMRATDAYVDPDAYLERAAAHEGSWWPEWQQWLVRDGGEQVKARKPRKPIEPAVPGSSRRTWGRRSCTSTSSCSPRT